MLTRIVVTPLGDHPDAIAATIRTLEALPSPAGFVYTDTTDGLIYGVANHWEFVRFACEQQGYAAKVECLDPPPMADEQIIRARRHEAEQAAGRARDLAYGKLAPDLARRVLSMSAGGSIQPLIILPRGRTHG